MYKGIAIGKVTDVYIDKDTQKVMTKVELDKEAMLYTGKESEFWLVSPKVSLTGISGLETLISGTYINANPIKGEPATKFIALDEAPTTSLFEATKIYLHQLIN